MQDAPAANVVPQSVLWPPALEKSPVVMMREMVRVELPMFWRVTTWAAPVLPLATLPHVSEVGLTVTVVPLAATVRFSVVVFVMLPETPVIVMADVPSGALEATVIVSALVEVAGLGLNPVVTPVGMPVALRVTLPLNPFAGTTVMVLVP